MIASVLGFMTAANNGSAFGMVLCVAFLPVVLFSTRRLFAFLSRSEGGKLERVVEELAELVGDSEGETGSSTGAT